jgi:hypothetical protein
MSITKAVTILLLCLPTIAAAQESNTHKFLDKTNVVLFTTHAVTTGWDAWETHNGVNAKACTKPYVVNATTTVCLHYQPYLAEANPLGRPFVGTTPGQVFFFGGTVVANIGAAYLLHRSGHHKIERIVSAVNIGFSINGGSSWTHGRPRVLPPAACVRVGTCQ